jgi:hypothetical protein
MIRKETKTIRLAPDVLEKIKGIAPEGQLALYIRMLIAEDFKKRGLVSEDFRKG